MSGGHGQRVIDLRNRLLFLVMGKIKTPKTDYTRPGPPMSQEEFVRHIREAEKGPFHSMTDLKNKIEEWKKMYEKL
jgi:hypothetical protein